MRMMLLLLAGLLATSVAYAATGSADPTINELPLVIVVGFIGKYATDLARGLWNLLPKKWGLKLEGKGVVVLAFAICIAGAYVWCQIPGVAATFSFWAAIEASLAALGIHQIVKE